MQKNYKYIIFSPYFGKLPAMFDLWAQSCGQNPDFLFVVFTDDTHTKALPKNVQIKNLSFQALHKLVQSKFDFPIALQSPYKLCDYRPAFGYIFEEYLQNCSYWGYCDMDLIFGNITKFLPEETADKISHVGHLCMYRNLPKITKAFMLPSEKKITYRDVFSSPVHFAFDENDNFGINAIFRTQKLFIYPFDQSIADVSCLHTNFWLSHYQNPGFTVEEGERIFLIRDGDVYSYMHTANGITQKKYAYVHIQKRHLTRAFEGPLSQYLITPIGFERWKPITPDLIHSCQIKTSYWRRVDKFLSIKRSSFPRALRRQWAIWKINKSKKGKAL